MKRWAGNAAFKVLERVIWRADVRDGKPVRYRASSSVQRPFIAVNRFYVSVWLPVHMARYIRILSQLTRQWQKAFTNGKHYKPPVKRCPRNGTTQAPFVADDLFPSFKTNLDERKKRTRRRSARKRKRKSLALA